MALFVVSEVIYLGKRYFTVSEILVMHNVDICRRMLFSYLTTGICRPYWGWRVESTSRSSIWENEIPQTTNCFDWLMTVQIQQTSVSHRQSRQRLVPRRKTYTWRWKFPFTVQHTRATLRYLRHRLSLFVVDRFVCFSVSGITQKIITRRRSCSFTEYWKHFMARFNDVHASGYNSAWSERIWVKFGALRVYYILTDFGRDTRRSESGEWAEIFCLLNNARLYRFPMSQISQNLNTRRGSMSPWILRNIFENLPVRGIFSKKVNFCVNIDRQRLPTSGRDFFETITNRGESRQVGQPTECWFSICTVEINSKSFPLACRLRRRNDIPGHRRLFRPALQT